MLAFYFNNLYEFIKIFNKYLTNIFPKWRHDAVVIITTQLHSTKPELSFCAGLNTARVVLQIRDGEDL